MQLAPQGRFRPFATRPSESKIAPATPNATGLNRDRSMTNRLVRKSCKLDFPPYFALAKFVKGLITGFP
jgi:hypothetical protein